MLDFFLGSVNQFFIVKPVVASVSEAIQSDASLRSQRRLMYNELKFHSQNLGMSTMINFTWRHGVPHVVIFSRR